MKFTKQNLLKLIVGFAVLGLAADLRAQTTPGKAVVRALKGSSTFSTAGSAPAPLKVNSVLYSGTTIKTGRDSQVDLFLGNSAGLVRVTENTTLSLDKLAFTETGADTVVEVQLNLPDGTILGNVNKLSAASKYEVKVPNGVAGIRGTQYRINSSAYVVLLNGSLIMVYVPSGGNPTPYPLFAPPAQYFSPLEGVKPAPDELISELRKQFGSGTLPPGPPADHPPGLINPPGNPTIFIEPGTGRPTTEH